MQQTSIHRVIVCGAGTMGSGIAETAARAGYITTLYDPAAGALVKAESGIRRNLDMLVDKEKISAADRQKTLEHLHFTSDINNCKGDLVIEAIIEDLAIKKQLFSKLAELNPPTTILASNTSSLSVSAIAGSVDGRERICGLHFFNPAQVMKLVEVVETPWCKLEVTELAKEFVMNLGKVPVLCKDSPGFIVNRVARHYYLEALNMVEQGICDIETADRLLENAGFRMGPFRLMDLIGNDVNLAVTRSLYEAFGKAERFKPSPIQEDKVGKGELGRKTGKGYYTY